MGRGRFDYASTGVAVLVMLLCLDKMIEVNSQSPNISAIFVFGDSLVDIGNNNFLNTMAKSNFLPYGIDFSRGATGRFTNGKSPIDFMGELLGAPCPPPFADPSSVGSTILNGVNFASASGGILDESGRHYGDRYSMSKQVMNFNDTLNKYRTMMNATTLSQYLAKSITIMVSGNNDYINNYLLPELYRTRSNYTAQEFGNLLVSSYTQQIMALYNLGLRKFFIAGIAPLGCTPNQKARGLAPLGRCVESVNQMVGFFNEGLRSTMDQLNKNYPNAIFVYANTYNIFEDIMNNPATYSINFVNRACCGVGLYRGQLSCLPYQFPCAFRSRYMFWDAFHPTQSIISIFSWKAVNGPPKDSYPINMKQMALRQCTP